MKRGFTLIELLVVVLIIGILASIALPQYQRAVDKARFSGAFPLAKAIQEAEELYFMENGQYTDTMEDLDITLPYASTCSDEQNYCYFMNADNTVRVTIYKTETEHIPASVYVETLKTGGAFLVRAFVHNTNTHWKGGFSACYAPDGNERANNLCKSVSGKASGSPAGEHYVYRI